MDRLRLIIGDGEGPAQQAVNPATVMKWWNEYAFLVGRAIDGETLIRALALAELWGTAPHCVLLSQGWVTERQYVEALASDLGVSAFGEAQGVPAPSGHLLEATRKSPEEVAASIEALRRKGRTAVLASAGQLEAMEAPDRKAQRSQRAVESLLRASPVLSAGTPVWSWQLVAVAVGSGLIIGSALAAPELAKRIAVAALALAFLPVVLLRAAILALAVGHRSVVKPPRPPGDAELPEYSILVPLFRESEVLDDLVRALCDLDYPQAKLDVLLILEAVDTETRRAVEAIELPGFMRVIIVPDSHPRTKPKALNYALQFARGSHVVVYDAEDVPERDQLRRAAALFREAGAGTFCLQARLDIHNAREAWLARQFALEYSVLFGVTLPGLVRLRLPVPLGGTSNHFPRRVLDRWTGWDPFNVTEDADLGVRLARCGGRVRMLESTTWEEAPVRFGTWLRQRTRWHKGWMQTYLVHTRRPLRLWKELGPLAFLGFHAYCGGLVLSALVFPWFCLAAAHGFYAGDLLVLPASGVDRLIAGVCIADLVLGFTAAMLSAALAAVRRGRPWLIGDLPGMPLYWLLVSLAAHRALFQLMVAPYKWEKTQHQARSGPPVS
jgi:glycosyltransferase involved in cell wall biosynthesis